MANMHNYAFRTSNPTRADILELGYSEDEARNILTAIKENVGEPHYWWMSLADGASDKI